MAKRVWRAVRLLGECAFGLAIVAILFTGLTRLIASGESRPVERIDGRKIDFEFVPPREEAVPPRPIKPVHDDTKPPPVSGARRIGHCPGCPEDPPPLPAIAPTPPARAVQRFELAVLGSDGEPTPVVRILPDYPPGGRGDGSVLVRFDISALGTVMNTRVIESTPVGMFDRAALQAIARWRYRPAVIDGQAVERRGVQVRLRFELQRA